MRKTKLSLFATLLAMASNQNGQIGFGQRFPLMNAAGGDGGNGGGGAGGDDDLTKAKNEITKLQADIAALKAGTGGGGAGGDDKDKDKNKSLLDKARELENQNAGGKASANEIERNISFNLGIEGFVKDHKDILPAEVETILKLANKENYDSAADKAAAIRSGMIDAFFSIASNLELLTQSQKIQLEDFKKLTKNGKEEKASKIYENVFEPALEIIKRVKKAEELGRSNSGRATASTVDAGYKERLINGARKTHLKVKGE